MTTSRPLLPFVLASAAACTSGPAWTEAEHAQLAALQQAVQAELAAGPALWTTPAQITLPDGKGLDDVDEVLHVMPSSPRDGRGGYRIAWGIGSRRLLPATLYCGEHETMLAVAGRAMAGFDAVHDFTVAPGRGAVLVATRRGEQTVASAAGVWTGSLWHRSFRPELSTDGSHFAYVEDNWFKDRVILAPTNAPERGTPLVLPGVVQWPVWPGRDGSRVRAIVVAGGRVAVHDGGQVVATADTYAHPFYDAEYDELIVHLTTGGRATMLIGNQQTPPLDSYRWLERSRDGKHYAAAGREGDRDCVVVDGRIVLQHPKLVWMELAADGSTWACAVQEGEQCFVVRPSGRSGPMPRITELILAPDGSSLAVNTRVDRKSAWTVDGVALGAGYHGVRDVIVLPAGRGAVFCARNDAGSWLVTPDATDGPWEEIRRCQLLADGKHVICLARRGREAHRRVLPLSSHQP